MKYQRHHDAIKETPPQQRPRERMQLSGAAGLSDFEILSIIIGSGSNRFPVHEIAQRVVKLLDKNGPDVTIEQLRAVRGLGTAKSCLIAAVIEFGRRRFHNTQQRISYPSDAYPLIRHYADRPQEHFLCLRLNGAHEVIGVNIVSIGLVNRTIVHPREVFARPIQERSTAIIVAHNHPSGNLEPSQEDVSVTKRLGEAGSILGIELLDHIIFTHTGYFSFLERGLLSK